MQTSDIKQSETNLDDNNKDEYDSDRQDFNQLACCLKNAIFSKYISNYLIEKTEEMWILYEKRIDRFLKEKHLDLTCNDIRPQTIIDLKELAKHHQENINSCKRDIEILCSSRKHLRNDHENSIRLQTTSKRAPSSGNSIRVPKIPKCIDRNKIINDIFEINIDE